MKGGRCYVGVPCHVDLSSQEGVLGGKELWPKSWLPCVIRRGQHSGRHVKNHGPGPVGLTAACVFHYR